MTNHQPHIEAPTGANPLGLSTAPKPATRVDAETSPDGAPEEVKIDGNQASAGAQEPFSTLKLRAKKMFNRAEGQLRRMAHDAKERLAPVENWMEATIREHPARIVATLAGASFLAGLLMRRRTLLAAGLAAWLVAGSYARRRSTEAAYPDGEPTK